MSDSHANRLDAESLQKEATADRLRRRRDSLDDELPAGGTSYRRRVTLCQCLLNTNESNGGASAVAELKHFLERTLFTAATLEKVLLHASLDADATPRRIQKVEIRAASIEIGSVMKRVHAHWVMKIVHSDLKLNVGRMQGIMQQITRDNTSWANPFVSVVLLDAKPENYALKEVFDDI